MNINENLNIEEFYRGLDRLFSEKNKEAVKDYLEEWYAKSERSENVQARIAVSNELGGLCRVTGQIDRAKELYGTVLDLLEKSGLSSTEHYAAALINTGDVYIFSKEREEARECFLKARSLLEELGFTGDYRMAALCNNISMVYRETGDYDEAEEALDTAFRIISSLPDCRKELATTHVNLGEVQLRQGKLSDAAVNFREACDIFNEDGGIDVHYAYACAGLGQLYRLEGDHEESVKYYEKALSLIERDFGKTPFYNDIAAILEEMKGN